MRNQVKNEEHFESSEGVYPSHANIEWVEGGETWIGCMSATARLRHAFVPPGPYHVVSVPGLCRYGMLAKAFSSR
jgi:hypothetical protein